MKTVKDIMSPVVFSLEETLFLPEAAERLRSHGISGAPVVNATGEYVGVLTQTDISGRVASVLNGRDSMQVLLESDLLPDIASVQVREFMSREVFKISSEASLEELGQALLQAGVHRLMVVEKDQIIGLVSTTDLIHGFMASEGQDSLEPRRPNPKPYLFETELTLDQDQGVARIRSSYGKEITVEPSPEFGGTGRFSSPEDLFVASINSCLSLTFREFAERADLDIQSYTCRAIGRLEGDGVSQRFTRVDLYPKIAFKGSREKTERILQQAKIRCLVGRSADVMAVLHPTFQEI